MPILGPRGKLHLALGGRDDDAVVEDARRHGVGILHRTDSLNERCKREYTRVSHTRKERAIESGRKSAYRSLLSTLGRLKTLGPMSSSKES